MCYILAPPRKTTKQSVDFSFHLHISHILLWLITRSLKFICTPIFRLVSASPTFAAHWSRASGVLSSPTTHTCTHTYEHKTLTPCQAHLQAQPLRPLQPLYLRQACPSVAPLTLSSSASPRSKPPASHFKHTHTSMPLWYTQERQQRGKRSVGLLKHKEPLEEH